MLLPRRPDCTREDSFVSLSQSDNCPQNFVGHKLSDLSVQWQSRMADDVYLINVLQENLREV